MAVSQITKGITVLLQGISGRQFLNKQQQQQICSTRHCVQQPSVAQLRSTMVDPAINLFFLKMKGELEQTKDKLEQAQNELSAWKFKPDR
uniref:Pre-mRNA-splicing regulator WTAP n=1 Tax=Spermophilus dauricus TaxID=99837 RepID=A0A8C9UM42_SPEDA